MWTPGPFETKPTRAYYYLTDVERRGAPSGRKSTCATSISARSGASRCTRSIPGHFVQYQHLRQVESKVRKSIFFASASFVEGWAHYCEQMMIDAGFGGSDHASASASCRRRSFRLVRFVVSIRLHAEDLSVEQGVRLFRTMRFSRKPTRGAKPSAARSIRGIWCIRSGS